MDEELKQILLGIDAKLSLLIRVLDKSSTAKKQTLNDAFQQGFTVEQLSNRFMCSAQSIMEELDNLSELDFQIWTARKDPMGHRWRWDGSLCRFFRVLSKR